MTPARLGIGLGVAALLMYGLANALPDGGSSKVRYINVEGTTYRMTRLGGGRFEVAVWGAGVVFATEPGAPLATYVLGQDGPISVAGNPNLIDLIQENMNKFPANLFTDEMKGCSKPGCFVP